MTAVSAPPTTKRRKLVYGKLVNRSNWNVDSFFDEDELASPELSRGTEQRQVKVKETYTVTKPAKTIVAAKSARPRAKRQDTFDIPSSDDEITSPAMVVQLPKFSRKAALVDDTNSDTAELAPWERRRLRLDQDEKKERSRYPAASPEAQLRQDLMRAASVQQRAENTAPSPNNASKTAAPNKQQSPSRSPAAEQSSAMARLAARKTGVGASLPKRNAQETEGAEDTPRKRARKVQDIENVQDVSMIDMPPELSCEPRDEAMDIGKEHNSIFDLPASSEDEKLKTKPKCLPVVITEAKSPRGKLTTYRSRKSLQKGFSAPARLTEMLTDTDTTEAPTRSPSATSRRSTPHAPSTPPQRRIGSPETALKATGTMTPKQFQLWDELLPSDGAVPSPSTLPIKRLSISGSGRRQFEASSSSRKLSQARSDLARRRTRLADRLKASAPSSDDVSMLEDDEGPTDRVIQPEDEVAQSMERPKPLQRMASHMSQTHSQMPAIANSGPKITYGQSRSYLQDEGAEQDFMVDLAMETPRPAEPSKRVAKPAVASQKSAFDLEESDDDTALGKIRTIHELRASGRTISGMYDIEELLGEIQNHSASRRGRRRSALIELTTKLFDKPFAMRFVGLNLEIDLAAECRAASDDVADFVLATAMALILASEPPEHTVRSLHDHGVVKWLATLLNHDVLVDKLAKDRRSNLSKSAQRSLHEFADEIKRQTSLWGESAVSVLTPRLIALEALDLLVSKLRRLGDKSELLGPEQVSLILPVVTMTLDAEKAINLRLSVSILESLSTSTASLCWPIDTVERIAAILPRLDATSPTQQHTAFLILRLCLNLTNDNARNCLLLSDIPTVQYLLHAVKEGFDSLDIELPDDKRALSFDLLVLAMGIMINLAETCEQAREHALIESETLSSLIAIFQKGQKQMLEAESVEESVTNVAFGYLAIVLANLCQNTEAKKFISSRLPGKNLDMLIEAVEEFVLHHQKVDMMNFEGEEGMNVWGAFTEKLKLVLSRLKESETMP